MYMYVYMFTSGWGNLIIYESRHFKYLCSQHTINNSHILHSMALVMNNPIG